MSRWIAAVLRARWVVIAIYAVLVPICAVLATRIPSEGAIERLMVPGDPDYTATREFQKVFPEHPIVLVVFEAAEPWSPETLARIERVKTALAGAPHISSFSLVDTLRHARPGASLDELRSLATKTDFFRRQALLGDHFMTLIVSFAIQGPHERDEALRALDHALAQPGIGTVHVIGAPIVTSWIEHASAAATGRSFLIFAVLMLGVTWFLYRSLRALLAIVLALGTAVALTMGAGYLLGFSITIVSSLVPMTVMVTTLATLTYLHSRFIDQPPDLPLEVHHVAALRNKLLPVTASTVAAALGFAALAVSKIRPIRDMGIWTAVGLVLAWVVSYTLFPALQRVLRTPTRRHVAVRSRLYERISQALPGFTYHHRKALVAGAIAGCIAGAIAIVGLPGVISSIPLRVDALSNIDPASPVYRDLSWFRRNVMDLNIVRVWIHLPDATATDPEVLAAVDRFQTALEHTPKITAVSGPTTPLRLRSYFAGHGERLPTDPDQFAESVGDVEQLMLSQPEMRTFIDANGLSDYQLTVLFKNGQASSYRTLAAHIDEAWQQVAKVPGLRGAKMRVVGETLLQVKVGASLVPTMTHSLILTVVLILIVFLVVFRSGIERLLAMIPSLFALLVTFLGMRLFGGTLNVATIIIATTVLGTTENDQLHFFHHMHEVKDGTLEDRLRHAFAVSGRAVVFATIINAVGFLGLAATRFPPLREFGLMTAAAFVLALIADFTVLPAALWISSRQRPREDESPVASLESPV